jgi:hypothetical protein
MNRINLLSRGALREDMSSPLEMGYTPSGLSRINPSANFNPFQFGSGQGPRRGVTSFSSFPPFGKARPAPGTPPDTPFQDISEVDPLHHSMPNINYSHEMLPFDEESRSGPFNHSLPNLNHSVPAFNYTHEDAPFHTASKSRNLNHSVPDFNYTHEDAPFHTDSKSRNLNHSVPDFNYTHEDAPFHTASKSPNLNHHSVPDFNYTHEDATFHTASTDIEPIPYDHYAPPNRKRSLKKDIFSVNTAVTAAIAETTKNQARSVATESDDMLTCLIKLTETTIGDDNPFEPIPLANSSEHMISLDHGRFDDEDMTPDFAEDQSESLGLGELRGIDI